MVCAEPVDGAGTRPNLTNPILKFKLGVYGGRDNLNLIFQCLHDKIHSMYTLEHDEAPVIHKWMLSFLRSGGDRRDNAERHTNQRGSTNTDRSAPPHHNY